MVLGGDVAGGWDTSGMGVRRATAHSSRGGLPRSRELLLVVTLVILLGATVGLPLTLRPSGPGTGAEAPLSSRAGPDPSTGLSPSMESAKVHGAVASIGSVISTLDLASNQLHSESAIIGVQDQPEVPVYDPENGNIYIRGNIVGDISVVNATTFTDVADIAATVDDQPSFFVPSIAVDTLTGYLYATNAASNNVTIIDGATESVSGSVTTGGGPRGIAYDPRNHDLYVADYGTDQVSVFSGTNNQSVATVPVGTDPLSVIYDAASDRVFVTNYGSSNVSVIDPSTNTVSSSVGVGSDPLLLTLNTVDDLVDVLDYPGGTGYVAVFSATSPPSSAPTVMVGNAAESFAFDAGSDSLFVAAATSVVTVISQPSDTVTRTDTIGPGSAYSAIAYDPRNGDVVVSAFDGGPGGIGNVTVISGATGRSIENDSTNDGPMGVAVDPGTGNAYVVNVGTSTLEPNVTVLGSSTGLPIASVPLWVAPTGLAYDSAERTVYTVDNAGNDIYRINTASGLVAGVESGGPHPTSTSTPAPVVYDGANGDIYATDPTEEAVDVYAPTHTLLTRVPVGLYPVGMAYDNASQLLFVAEDYNGNVTIIDTATNTVLAASLTVKNYDILSAVAYDPHNNEVYVADRTGGNVTVWGAQNHTNLRSIPVGSSPTSIVFDPENNTLFVANEGSSNVSVIDDTTNSVVHSVSLGGAYLLAYDAGSDSIYNAEYFTNDVEAFNASTYATLSGSPLYLGGGGGYYVQGLAFDPANGEMYVDDSTGDALYALGTASASTYPVDFVETGLPQGTSWGVTLNGVTQTATAPSSIDFPAEKGNLPFSVGAVPGYTANVSSGTVDVTTSARTVDIGFTPDEYGVAFVEVGLPPGSLWNVTLNSVQNHSTTDTVGFMETAGTYPFTVGGFTGYVVNVTHGSVTITSSAVVVDLEFSPVGSVYPVTFVETGLPGSTLWSVTFHGVTNSSTTSSIGFLDPNGTWGFTVGAIAGYSANVSSGSIHVDGAPAQQEVAFSHGTTPLSVRLAVDPSSITLRNSTTVTATVSGGTSPFSYVYSGLPQGCVTQNSSSWSCTPTDTGSFTVRVNVTDSAGGSANATTTLTVTASPPSGPNNSSGLGTDEIIGGAVAVVGIALVVFFIVGRRRHSPPGPPAPPSAPPPAP
jgi:YVTN family beta-propeller protein